MNNKNLNRIKVVLVEQKNSCKMVDGIDRKRSCHC